MDANTINSVPRVNLDELRARMSRLKGFDDCKKSESQPRLALTVLHNPILESAVKGINNTTDACINTTVAAASSRISPGESVFEPTMNPNATSSSFGDEVAVGIVETTCFVPHNTGSITATTLEQVEHGLFDQCSLNIRDAPEYELATPSAVARLNDHTINDILTDSMKRLKRVVGVTDSLPLLSTTSLFDSVDDTQVQGETNIPRESHSIETDEVVVSGKRCYSYGRS